MLSWNTFLSLRIDLAGNEADTAPLYCSHEIEFRWIVGVPILPWVILNQFHLSSLVLGFSNVGFGWVSESVKQISLLGDQMSPFPDRRRPSGRCHPSDSQRACVLAGLGLAYAVVNSSAHAVTFRAFGVVALRVADASTSA